MKNSLILDYFHPTEGVPHFFDKSENGPNYKLVEVPIRSDLLIYNEKTQVTIRIDVRKEKENKALVLKLFALSSLLAATVIGLNTVDGKKRQTVFMTTDELIAWIEENSSDFRAPQKLENAEPV